MLVARARLVCQDAVERLLAGVEIDGVARNEPLLGPQDRSYILDHGGEVLAAMDQIMILEVKVDSRSGITNPAKKLLGGKRQTRSLSAHRA